jgi:hypothetical protein
VESLDYCAFATLTAAQLVLMDFEGVELPPDAPK